MDIYTIYRATNLINGKCYIGFDSAWPKRQKVHQRTANNNTGQYFHCAIRKHGWENFVWEVIYQSLDGHHCLNTMEAQFIVENEAYRYGYNLTVGGEGAIGWYNKMSLEDQTACNKKRSATYKCKSHTEKNAIRQKISNGHLNRTTEEKAITSKKKSDYHKNNALKKANVTPVTPVIKKQSKHKNERDAIVVCDITTKKTYNRGWAMWIGLIPS